jgi:DNA-binding transcriptional LysR family regulator
MLAEVASAEAEVMWSGRRVTGLIRINAPMTFGILHLALVWGAFKQQHPDVFLDVTLNDETVDVVSDRYDLVVRIGQLASSSLIGRKLASTRVVLCAAPSYLRSRGTPLRPADLLQHDIISYSHWSSGDVWSFAGPNGPESVRTRPSMQTNNGDTCRAAALAGQGVILQPTFLIGKDLLAARLVELLPGYRSLQLDVLAVYVGRKYVPVRIKTMVEFLAPFFKTARWPE